MGRMVVLFLAVGLAVGLWLGFNPTTHRELVRWWDRTTTSHTARNPSLATDIRRLDRALRSTPRPQPEPASQPAAIPSAAQIHAELQTFWNALRQLWLSFLAKLHIASS